MKSLDGRQAPRPSSRLTKSEMFGATGSLLGLRRKEKLRQDACRTF